MSNETPSAPKRDYILVNVRDSKMNYPFTAESDAEAIKIAKSRGMKYLDFVGRFQVGWGWRGKNYRIDEIDCIYQEYQK